MFKERKNNITRKGPELGHCMHTASEVQVMSNKGFDKIVQTQDIYVVLG